MWPLPVNTASATDCTRAAACVTTSSRYFGQRSTNTPASAVRHRIGRNCSAETMPSAVAECEMSSTSQACAIRCIQLPAWETSCPIQNSRKLYVAREANVPPRHLRESQLPFEATSVLFGNSPLNTAVVFAGQLAPLRDHDVGPEQPLAMPAIFLRIEALHRLARRDVVVVEPADNAAPLRFHVPVEGLGFLL